MLNDVVMAEATVNAVPVELVNAVSVDLVNTMVVDLQKAVVVSQTVSAFFMVA